MRLYGLFYLGSFVLFVVLSASLLKGRKLDRKVLNLFTLVYIVGMMFGAHALYYLVCKHTWINRSPAKFYADFSSDRGRLRSLSDLLSQSSRLLFATVGAGGFWGGPWFAVLGLLPFAVFLKLDVRAKRQFLDVFAVSFPFALALAKVGCFLTGCCHGVEGVGPLFVTFTWAPEDSPWYMKSYFPTQLLDLSIYLAIGAGLAFLLVRRMQKGRLILWFVFLYSTGRFLSEFTRGDNIGGKFCGLSPVQIALVVSFILSSIFLLRGSLFHGVLTIRALNADARIEGGTISESDRERIWRLDRRMFATLIVLLFACLFVLPSIPLLLLIVPFLTRLYSCLKARSDPVRWSRLFNAFAYFMIDFLFVSAFLLTTLVPFYVGFVVFVGGSTAILNRFFESMALPT
jgi:prolipoprotein diacylglyceryltransferase